METLIRTPHAFLRRHLSAVERVLVAGGLAFALYQVLQAFPAYPSPWEVVIAGAIFLVLLWSPPVAYFLAVVAAIYPLYTISLYLAVLFLAVALLGQRVFIYNLGATLLVLLTPWLAQYDLAWLAPLLGGLWWGKVGGAWIGGLAALWSQILFGMTGADADWILIFGTGPDVQGLIANFKEAGSLDTLRGIIAPLAPDPTLLLYHLLQATVWAMAAGLVGALADRTWTQQKRPWRAIVITVGGAFGLFLAHMGLVIWLERYPQDVLFQIGPWLFQVALVNAGVAGFLEALRDFVEHPLPILFKRPERLALIPVPTNEVADSPVESGRFRLVRRLVKRLGQPNDPQDASLEPGNATSPAAQPAAYTPVPVPQNLPKRDPKKQRPDDRIKIELD